MPPPPKPGTPDFERGQEEQQPLDDQRPAVRPQRVEGPPQLVPHKHPRRVRRVALRIDRDVAQERSAVAQRRAQHPQRASAAVRQDIGVDGDLKRPEQRHSLAPPELTEGQRNNPVCHAQVIVLGPPIA